MCIIVLSKAAQAVQLNIPGLNLPGTAGPQTEILCLMNMVTPDDLKDDDEYEGRSLKVNV